MSQPLNSEVTAKTPPSGRFLEALLVVFIMVLTSLPFAPVALARHPTPPEAASPQPQDSPTATPTPTPTPDEVLDQAKREAQIAEELKKKAVSDKDRAEAENAKLKAETQPLGAASITIPTGSVQTDAAGWVESQMLAQEAARQITTGLAGKLCTGKLLQGGVADQLTGEVAVPTQNINTLVIYNNNDLAGVELYVTVLGQLSELQTEFTNENPKAVTILGATDPRAAPVALAGFPILAAPAVASGAIKSVAELMNLFRTDTSFQNKTVQISEDMVVSHIVDYFGNNGMPPPGVVAAAVVPAASRCNQSVKVYYPALFPPRLVRSTQNSTVLTTLNHVEGLKNTAALLLEQTDARIKDITNLQGLLADKKKKGAAQVAKTASLAAKEAELKKCTTTADCNRIRAEIKDLKKDIADLVKAIADIDGDLTPNIIANGPNFKQWLATLTELKNKLQSRITATEVLSAKLNTPDPTSKFTALAQLLRAEKLNGILGDPQTFTLRVAVNANGTTKIKKNMFVDAKVRHSAGANVVYQLFNRDGVLAQGDVMQCYISYQSSQDVQGVMTGAKIVECKSN